jgi:single-strand selective monofunctional uracil DNA glycosylase
MEPRAISRRLAAAVDALVFAPPVAVVYDPLVYARRAHEAYLEVMGAHAREVLLLGMNPGPFGMAQTGVPFGDVRMARDWLGVSAEVEKPAREHPRRPIEGFACPRREVSGTRLWSWARERWGTPAAFFRTFAVWNYCPLAFLEEGGKNRTPDKLPAAERAALFAPCDAALVRLVEALGPRQVVGVGAFAEGRARAALGTDGPRIGRVPHPSPASPLANRGWAAAMDAGLAALGIRVPARRGRGAAGGTEGGPR